MIVFLQDDGDDLIMYHPIMKELNRNRIENVVLDIRSKSIQDIVIFLSTRTCSALVVYGASELKLAAVLLFNGMGIKTVLLEGHHRIMCPEENPVNASIRAALAPLVSVNLVSGDSARLFLIESGIKSPIHIFECPISYMCRRVKAPASLDALLICSSNDVLSSAVSELACTTLSSKTWMTNNVSSLNVEAIYNDIAATKYIISDSFMWDTAARNLGKHFFYTGSDPTALANLGITTHMIYGRKRKKLQDFLNEYWSFREPSEHKYGIQSAIQCIT